MSALPACLSPRISPLTLADRLAHVIRARLSGRDPRQSDAGQTLPVDRLTRVGPGLYEMSVDFEGQLYRVRVEREIDAMRHEIREAN